MATRYFQWDHPDAPVLDGTAGSFMALMKALLVGTAGVAYGSGADEKLAAGWTLEWEDTGAHKIVMRSPPALGGSGCYLRIVDNNATYALVECFESMSDIDTGSAGTGQVRVQKSSDASSTTRPWGIIADGRTCYGTVLGGATSVGPPSTPYYDYSMLFGFGDYEPFIPGDPGIFAAGRGVSDGGPWTDTGWLARSIRPTNINSSDSIFFSTRTNSLSPTATKLGIAGDGDRAFGADNSWIEGVSEGLSGGYQWTVAPVASTGCVRGMMRGMYVPLNRISTTHRIIGDTATPAAVLSPPTLHVLGFGYVLSFVGFSGGVW